MSTGAYVQFNGFQSQNLQEIISQEILPTLEKRGILLSDYGNHASQRSLRDPIEYWKKKKVGQLGFNESCIQACAARINDLMTPAGRYMLDTSYGIKAVFERYLAQVQGKSGYQYISNGDMIMALLIKGYRLRFTHHGEKQVNPEVKAKYRDLNQIHLILNPHLRS